MHLIKWRRTSRILHVRCSDPSWLRLVQSSFQQFSRALAWTAPSYNIPFAFDHPQGRTPARQIISYGSFFRVQPRENRMRRIPHSFTKRAGFVTDGSNRRRRKMIRGLTTHPTSMTALWRMFVNYNSCVREGGNRIPGWDFEFPCGDLWHDSEARGRKREREGGFPVACRYDISNECLQHNCEMTLWRCKCIIP